MEVIFISKQRRISTNFAIFENYTFTTKNQKLISQMRECSQNNKLYKEWSEDVTPPIEFIPQTTHSITWEFLDEITKQKALKELFVAGREKEIADIIYDMKNRDFLLREIRALGIQISGKNKEEIRAKMLANAGGRITLDLLHKWYYMSDKVITEEQFEQLKGIENGDSDKDDL